MQTLQVKKNIQPEHIVHLLKNNFPSLMSGFYEMQSNFLSSRYKLHKSLETASIIISLSRSVHLEIIRQRETKLDYDFSLNNFWFNINSLNKPTHKIVSIVNVTGIPKETVRRKIKKLIEIEMVAVTKDKQYYWVLLPRRKNAYLGLANNDVMYFSKFIYKITNKLNLDFSQKEIQEVIKSQFSFFWYHFLSCQLKWLKMWQNKIKDIDLVLIALQALIPTLQFIDKSQDSKILNIDNIYSAIGKASDRYLSSSTAISAASVSEVTGIPRATCIRKLDKLVKLGMLIRETKTKRYLVNQFTSARTKNILTKENINFTIETFSEYLSVIVNALSKKINNN